MPNTAWSGRDKPAPLTQAVGLLMKNKKDFYAGIISALAVVKLHNADTIHSEIVELCNVDELLSHARAEGEIEFAGLGKYEAQHRVHQTAGGRGSKKSKLVVPAAGNA